MIKIENEHYIRFILLLIKGGTEVLRESVTRGLKRKNVSLTDFLQANKVKICSSKQITKVQRDILYPPSPHFSDISKWDISLLSHIALECMSDVLKTPEKQAFEKIRDLRNDVTAHSANAEIETRKFTNIWSELSLVITTLSHSMPDDDRVRLNNLISSLSSDQLDIYAAIEELKLLERRDDFFECIQTSLENLQQSQAQLALAVDSCHQDVLQVKTTMDQGLLEVLQVKKKLDQGMLEVKKQIFDLKISMENKGENTKIVNTMFGRVKVSAEEQTIVDTAETVLLTASVKSVDKSVPAETLRDVKESVDRLVGDVEGRGVKVDSVEEGSIVFTFTCSSLEALLDLIDYFSSIEIQNRLDDIAKALENMLGHKVQLIAYLPLEPLLDIIKKLENTEYRRTLKFTMTCTGVEGLQHAWNVFEEGAASNSLNKLSKALTDAVGKPVTLETCIDIEQMQKAIKSTKEQLDVNSGEKVAEKLKEVRLEDSEDEHGGKNSEEESNDSLSSDYESESGMIESKKESDPSLQEDVPLEKGKRKKRKKYKKTRKRDKKSKRQKLDKQNEVNVYSSVQDIQNDQGTISPTYRTTKEVVSDPPDKIEDNRKLNIDSASQSSSNQQKDMTKRSNSQEADGNTNKRTSAEDIPTFASELKKQKITRIPTESMDVEYTGEESTQTVNSEDEGYNVDTELGMQTRSKRKEKIANLNDDPGDIKQNIPESFKSEEQSTKDSYQPVSSSNIRVHFHILLPADFKFDGSVDKVILRIGNAMIGGWNSNEHVMIPGRVHPSGHIELSYTLDIPKYLILGTNKCLHYKYYVIRNTKTRRQHDRKNLWDHYYVKGSVGPHDNRGLNVPDKWKSKEIWHQFDAIVNRKPKDGILSSIKDYMSRKRKLRDDAKLAVQIYRDRILQSFNSEASPSDISQAVELIEFMMHGIRRVYFTDGKCFDSEEEVKAMLGLYALEPIMDSFEELNRINTNERNTQWRMTVQFALLAGLKNLNLFNLPKEHCDIYSRLSKAFLIHTDSDKKICEELEFLRLHYPKQQKFFKEAFVMLGKSVVKRKKDPAWLYIMPLVHFLSEACQPYEQVTDAATHTSIIPVWWGTSHIGEDTTKAFKNYQNESWAIPLHEVLTTLQPLFEIDYLLPRTFVASLNLFEVLETLETGLIPTEVCCATLTFHLKITRPKILYSGQVVSSEENLVCKCIQIVLKKLQEECQKTPECEDAARLKLATTVSLDLAAESLYHKSDRKLTASASLGVFLLCASQYHLCLEMQRNLESEQEKNIANIRYICESAITWVIKHWSDWTSLDACLEVWNSFMVRHVTVPEKIEALWNKSMTDALESSLSYFVDVNSSRRESFVKCYCMKADEFHPKMQTCLEQIAFKTIDGAYGIELGNFRDNERKKFGNLLSKLFDAEFRKTMQQWTHDTNREFLQKVLTWSPLLQFMKIFFSKQQMNLLNDECKLNLMKVISVMDTRVDEIFDGKITVGDLLLFHKHGEKFAEISELVKETATQKEKSISKKMVLAALEIRKRELDAFLCKADLIVTLTFLCKTRTKVDMSSLDIVLEKRATIAEHRLKEFCEPAVIAKVKNIHTFIPAVPVFSLSTKLEAILPRMHSYQKSSVFMKLWDAQCDQNGENCTSLDDIIYLWQPVSQSWEDLSHRIETGHISFHEFESLIGRMFREDYTMIAEELRTLGVSDEVIQKRIDQLKKYRHLETCRKGAKALLKFKQEYQLGGDFEQIKLIAVEAESKIQMEQFDDSFVAAFEFLKDFTAKRAQCLNTFLKCQPLVQWLKESMHTSGLKELQVFVDLALMSIGDDPYNIGKVQALHSAVTGYAPLIFDLTQKCGFRDLLELCKLVWRELDVNQKLPKQLEDTNCQLDWLREVKEAHGSVEVTSMMQMEAINSDGTFAVGRQAIKRHGTANVLDVNVLTVEDTVQVTVPEEQGKRQLRNYTFSQLQDLQSRLMLVAGKAEKGTDNVERFTMILDSVTRLSKFYLKLYSSGCVLFKEWSARFICDPDPRRPVCTVIDFGQSEEVPQLKGRTAVREDLKDMVPEIVRFMESCHDEWLEHIKEKRKSYLFLNYFTVDQLVILQRELVKFGTEDQPSHLIYPLLSGVKPDCTEDDIRQAMMSAKEEVDRKDQMEIENSTETESELEKSEHIDDTKRQTFIRKLVDAGQDEVTAIRALEYVDPEEFSQGILWCMEHADSDMSDHEEMDAQTTAKAGLSTDEPFQGWSQSKICIRSLIDRNLLGIGEHSEIGVKPLIKNLEQLWRQFLESISSNVKDYLSLEHLGIILGHLASKNSKVIDRSMPPGFKEGVPNLVVCPSDDVLTTALSIYMTRKAQPLPQSDEILMCTSSTTIDEVDIFWRRALFEDSRKIHCLLNAEVLTYDVSESSERLLQDYMSQLSRTDANYRLCVICGSGRKKHSGTMISFLDKFRRQAPRVNMNKMREYVAKKLMSDTKVGARSAAVVDKQRSTVRVIKSWRAGVGKSLFKIRRQKELQSLKADEVKHESVTIPLQEKSVNIHNVIERLLDHTLKPTEQATRLFHIDVSYEVQEGVDYLLFNLLILGCLTDRTGYVWRKSDVDLYLIETMPILLKSEDERDTSLHYMHTMLTVLPDVTCRSPRECLLIYSGTRLQDQKDSDQLFDDEEFRSKKYQRPFQYLLRLTQARQMDDIKADRQEGTPQLCLEILLRYCGIKDPSWAELHHFVWFLNTQLFDFKMNNFVSRAAAEDLPGFSTFVLKFLIQMSKDFSTRSLNISEESPRLQSEHDERMQVDGDNVQDGNTDIVPLYQMRRTWESSPHPYLFFNWDREAFTFLGFNIDKSSGDLLDQQTGKVLEKGIMQENLYEALERNDVPLQEDFNSLPRDDKIKKLRAIMGVESSDDPDTTYELTTDNVKKIMAIYMRFRCDIPVIIMGETGCGKTRLVKFMCRLQVPKKTNVTNMILMKVHGGTTTRHIIKRVKKAEALAKKNKRKYGDRMYTVLFFDEANSSEAIGLIKEIMCDKRMAGEKLKICENLKMVAACNPYRKHSEQLIKKLEMAGLGYHVDAEDTTDRLGRVPMRRLVYRVQPLPQSLLPLVWDFGQLNTKVENLYIQQMVKRFIDGNRIPDIKGFKEVTSTILTKSQEFMRLQKDECSFVSLRDVERVLTVMSWFHMQSKDERILYNLMDERLFGKNDADDKETMKVDIQKSSKVDDITRSLILAIGVCYHACLKTRRQYRKYISPHFKSPCRLPRGKDQILVEIDCCQDVFLDHVDLEKNIARNMALKENVFMMVVCIELRIPLFLIGKPGSSKSLAKTIVSDAMRGNAAKQNLFKRLKQAKMVSYQCSPISTPGGIVGTFKQCAQFQKDKDLSTFVSVVVLDEVGLAEDSPRMPLKTLHPLLEDGCQGDEDPEDFMKVAFIGISNWALDPAKMNRGIVVQREVPDLQELINSARGICKTGTDLDKRMGPLIKPMAQSYLELFNTASKRMREFFGLRDFYSLVKMVFRFVEKSSKTPTWHQMLHAVKRNFGGLDQVDPVESFKKRLSKTICVEDHPQPGDPDCSAAGLIRACLFDTNDMQSESRYLLLLTENYGALTIIQQLIQERSHDIRPITIFGSSFRSDQEYTQVCRNINKIKVCMETGNTVVLLNLENLYESLYDALNQYYVYFGDVRYVDLGLGTHRVKCPVHPNFRLIVVAEKETVYKKFPIPLINRLEKHFLTINTMLSEDQQKLVSRLKQWVGRFATQHQTMAQRRDQSTETKEGDVFIGFHEDSCSAIILHAWQKHAQSPDIVNEEKILYEAKCILLWCATPDALVRLERSMLPRNEQDMLYKTYHEEQAHGSVLEYLTHMIYQQRCKQIFSQITTHSKLMSTIHTKEISRVSGIDMKKILLIETLSSFDTEQQFSNRIRQHIRCMDTSARMIVIQCEHGDTNASLIACARYCVMDELEKLRDELKGPVHVIFIIQLPKVAGGCFTGFQCGKWHSAHIDDLLAEDMDLPTVPEMHGKSVGMLIDSAVSGHMMMETDELVENKSPVEEDMEWKEDSSVMSGQDQHLFGQTDMPGSHQIDRKDDLKLNDILFDLKTVEQNEGATVTNESTRGKLNVKKLILSCVQSALAMVKDKTEHGKHKHCEEKNRETDRVDLVIRLLHQDQTEGQPTFMQGICMLITKLLQEKESDSGTAHNATHWLVNEAAKLENINKAGTFRSSCIKVLESKIFPILAGIIAYCDTNENLNILEETQFPWKNDLWLAILNTPGAINLQYKDFQSPTRTKDLEEVSVMSTGCEGHTFSVRMPFSWLFIDQITEVLKLDHPSTDVIDQESNSKGSGSHKRNQRAESCIRILGEHPLCKIFCGIKEEHIIHDACAEYIIDLVHSMYPAVTEDEFNLIFESVQAMSIQLHDGTPNDSLLTSIVYIHLAFEALCTKLTYFHMLNVAWPECSPIMLKLKTENPDHYMFTENEMTFSAVCLLVENIAPKKSQLDVMTGRSKWLNNVHRYRSIVERVISIYDEDPTLYGASAAKIVRRIKALWCRVMVMKLFIEHVCVSDSENRMTVKFCTPLWSLLGEEADMKQKDSVTAVEKFLKTCNKGAMKEYLGSVVKCSDCEKVLEGAPISLPCKDVVCDRCYNDLIAARSNTCAKCRKTFADDWAPETNFAKSNAEEKLKDYQKRCNAFFMDVVSQLSFADKTPPSDDVVEKLLKYAFCETRAKRQHTKDLSIFDTGIDPNPVFRSFLLQLLLQTSEKKVIENLERYLKEAEAVVSDNISDKEQMNIKLSLLVISCVEDKLMQTGCTKDTDAIGYAMNALETAAKTIETSGLTVQKLYGLASARMGLAVVAHHIAKVVTHGPQGDPEIRLELLNSAKGLCNKVNADWPKKYLVKYLCRYYGIDVYQKACKCKLADLSWMAIMDMNKVVADRYIVCGKNYIELRETLTKALLGGNINILQKTLMELQKQDLNIEPMLQLAIYREVTSSHVHPQQKRKFATKDLTKLTAFITKGDDWNNKRLLLSLMRNQLVPRNLVIVETEDLRLQGIQSLIVHFLIVVTHLKVDRTIIQPFLKMIVKPQLFSESFLPTMPQDDLEDVKEALIASRRTVKGADKTVVFYRCPNGHPYVIGDCGKPFVKAKCPCGADIGGLAHKLLETNAPDTAKDQTMTGHILGRATTRGPGPKPERLLTPAQCAIIRLLIHMAMYLGVGRNAKEIQRTIKPIIKVDQVEKFLWQHIQLDIEDLHRALTKSVDDVILFMHCVIHEVMNTHDPGHTVEKDVYLWSTKRGRRDWEIAFVSRFLSNALKNMENLIQQSNRAIVNDTRLGSDPLLCLLYETDVLTESSSKLQEVPSVWRYRTPVSIQHLRQSLEAETGNAKSVQRKYNVLKLFLSEEYHLRALRFVPSILRLQRVLIQKYQKKLDKAEASQITVAKLKKEKTAGSETAQLLSDFTEAWEISRESLRFYLCTTEAGGATIPKGYCGRSINDDTPVSMLLPTIEGDGLCSYVLLDFLMRKQNDFLDKYMKETGRKSDMTVKVSPKDVTAAHLICYDPLRDLLTIVLANCQYTFKMGEGTSIDYDFSGLERQLMDRFLFSKSSIDVGPVLQIDMMIYRTEFTNSSVFKKLSVYIRQENINSSVKKQICNEIKSLPEICQDMYNLDITISFLKSTGGLPDQNLHKYMKKTLQMETTITSHKAQQMCQFKHVQSLWLLLALQKSKTMTDNQYQREYTFESVQQIFDVDLSDEELEKFDNYMRNLSEDKLSSLLEVLHEFILLKVAVKQNVDDEDYTDITEKQIKDWLLAYIEEKETPPLDIVILEDFPEAIKLKHSIHTWVEAYKMLKTKQTSKY